MREIDWKREALAARALDDSIRLNGDEEPGSGSLVEYRKIREENEANHDGPIGSL